MAGVQPPRKDPARCRVSIAAALLLALLAACARNDLAEPPMPLGEFALGLNIAVADKVQMVPISRPAEPKDWEAAIARRWTTASASRYQGSKLYNIGISVDAYALAPPGIPVVAAPKVGAGGHGEHLGRRSAEEAEPRGPADHRLRKPVGRDGDRHRADADKQQQMDALAFNAAVKVEDWLLEHPEWFDMTPDELKAALAARSAAMASAGTGRPRRCGTARRHRPGRAAGDGRACRTQPALSPMRTN
jgi:hypothetical protein